MYTQRWGLLNQTYKYLEQQSKTKAKEKKGKHKWKDNIKANNKSLTLKRDFNGIYHQFKP